MMYAEIIMLAGLALFQLKPELLLRMFAASDQMIGIGSVALREISPSFLVAGICIIGSSSMQALGHGLFSMLISFGRQLVVLLPVAFLLAQTGQLNLVWLSFPIAEVASLVLTAVFLTHSYRKEIQPMMTGQK